MDENINIIMQLYGYDVSVTKENTHIVDSYKAGNKDIKTTISALKKSYYLNKDFTIVTRSTKSLIREWRAHNVLYALHIFRSHTKDVDLNAETWYGNFVYALLSILWWKK